MEKTKTEVRRGVELMPLHLSDSYCNFVLRNVFYYMKYKKSTPFRMDWDEFV